MIISRTPFRVSFFGGGTDYPVWYREHGGAVLATTIDKYCYITCRYLPPFFDHKSRIVYSKVECPTDNKQIEHPAVRGTLDYMGITDGVEIHYDGDLPARTGLGSSSSFTIGLLHALYALKRTMPDKRRLAMDAIRIEQQLLKENVGSQDQISAAFGGLNRVDFDPDGSFRLSPIILSTARRQALQDHLMLFFTGFSRTASSIAEAQIRNTPNKQQELLRLRGMVDQAVALLLGSEPLSAFGRLLDDAWRIKRGLTEYISTPEIDEIYDAARRAGAIGGKLLGAGGGGFMLFIVRPEDQPRLKKALRHLLHVPFHLESQGSQIIFYEPQTIYEPPERRYGRRRTDGVAPPMSRRGFAGAAVKPRARRASGGVPARASAT